MNSRSLRSSHASGRHTFLIFLSGLVIGLVIAVVVAFYILQVPTPAVNNTINKAAEKPHVAPTLPPSGDPNAPLYGTSTNQVATPVLAPLPGSSVPAAVPTPAPLPAPASQLPSIPKQPATEPREAKVNNEVKGSYILQIAAYTSNEEADQQRARLAIEGYEVYISPHEINGVQYYRVRIGPFAKMAEADALRKKLQALKIDALLIKTSESS
jgi:cell division protein FtsN